MITIFYCYSSPSPLGRLCSKCRFKDKQANKTLQWPQAIRPPSSANGRLQGSKKIKDANKAGTAPRNTHAGQQAQNPLTWSGHSQCPAHRPHTSGTRSHERTGGYARRIRRNAQLHKAQHHIKLAPSSQSSPTGLDQTCRNQGQAHATIRLHIRIVRSTRQG